MATFEQLIQEASPNQPKQKKIGSYLIQKTLGKGTFGKVKLATHIPTSQKVAIKILQKDRIIDVADVQRVARQIHILKLIRHPNIIQLYQIIQTPRHLFLVMQYMQRGQLFDYIVSKKRMDQQQACKVFQQIISGIEYIHKLRIVHRDLKLQNLLIDYDKTIRIVDFGLSNTYKPQQRLRTACGSPCYAAPQMIQGKVPYQPLMVDIWSAGVILFAMVCGFLPFQDKDTPKLYRKILNGQYSISSHISQQLRDFINRILTVDPSKRITVQQMKKHVWWRKHSDTKFYPQGLIVGFHKIPVNHSILKAVQNLGFDSQLTQKSLQTNLHNNLTTTYYLLLKMHLRDGSISKHSIKQFDKLAVQSNERRSKNNLKPADLLKMITTPVQKQRAKSYYLGPNKNRYAQDNKSLGNNSVRIDRKRSNSKLKKDKNKSLQKHSFTYNSKSFKNNAKSNKKDKSMNRSMNKSTSKHLKSPKKTFEYEQDNQLRPKSQSQKNKFVNKKSHQGSYMIGAQSGIDWPLQPKWNKQAGGKIKNAIRRR